MFSGKRNSLALLCFLSVLCHANAQTARQIIAAVDSFNKRLPAEQLFLHFDKPAYALGDTIWFKGYLFMGATHAFSPLSGLLYVELINDSSREIKRMSVPISFGLAWGQLPLTNDDLREGSYTIRAYTRWMQNFGEECFFYRHFMIFPATEAQLMARLGRSASPATTGPTGSRSAGRTADAGPRTPATASPARRPTYTGKIDLQFMPESGWLVAGIPSRVGFKAIGENGLGIDIQGTIVDSRDARIASFHSLHNGMGIFDLLPASGEDYAAVILRPDGSQERHALPAVRKSGIVLRVENKADEDSIHLKIFPSADLVNGQAYHLVALSRGIACYGANFTLDKSEVNGIVAKNTFPSGIAHFTLFNTSGEPVNERIVYVDHADDLRIGLKADRDTYGTRDSIPVHIQVTDALGQPVVGSFSVAVTDDAQVHSDSLRIDNIVTRMLLTADLKGFVETPGWYFAGPGLNPAQAPGPNADQAPRYEALDALLLTQGWTGYHWQQIAKLPLSPQYPPEPSLSVTGEVTNLLNHPVKDARVVLMATGKTEFVMDTVTGQDGRFAFISFPSVDTVGFILQARNAKGKNFGLGLKIDETTPPALPPHNSWKPARWDEQNDSTLFQYVRNNETTLREKGPYGGGIKVLQPVIVKAQRGIKGSHNLNGPGEADQVVDEAMIEKAGKVNLRQLLLQTVKGFRTTYTPDGVEHYKILQYETRIIIDGINIRRMGPERETMEFLTAEDIQGIEVMYNMNHSANYKSMFLSAKQQMDGNKEYAFIEITTRSGNGAFFKRTPGFATFKPLPITWPQEFYRPRYLVKDIPHSQPDLRSTIHWQPNVVTDRQGQALVYFYSADTPSFYTILVEGSDMNGNVGTHSIQIQIKRERP